MCFIASIAGVLAEFQPLLSGRQLVLGCGEADLSALALGCSDRTSINGRVDEILREIDGITATFDCVVDKALDRVIYSASDERDQECFRNVSALLRHCQRSTRVGGTCVFVTRCPPPEMDIHMVGCSLGWQQVQISKFEAVCDAQGHVAADALVIPVQLGEVGRHSREGGQLRTTIFVYACTVAQQPAAGEAEKLEQVAEQVGLDAWSWWTALG